MAYHGCDTLSLVEDAHVAAFQDDCAEEGYQDYKRTEEPNNCFARIFAAE
jgi:hypothetical protein